MQQLLILDTETTGIPSAASRLPPQVIQIAAIKVSWPDCREIESFSVGLRHAPSLFSWSEDAAMVHGISRSDARLLPDLVDGLVRFREFVEPEARGHCQVAGWNPAFDLDAIRTTTSTIAPFLEHEDGATAEIIAGIPGALGYRCLDVATLAKVLFGLHSSNQACEWLGQPRATHDATEDCRWCLELLRRSRFVSHPFLNRTFAKLGRVVARRVAR